MFASSSRFYLINMKNRVLYLAVAGIKLRLNSEGLIGYNDEDNVGRVEVFYRERWGIVEDDDGWDTHDANMVCKHLGLHDAVAIITDLPYERQWTFTLRFHANKSSLDSLGWKERGYAIGVICEGPNATIDATCSKPSVRYVKNWRLMKSNIPLAGIIQIEICDGIWGTVYTHDEPPSSLKTIADNVCKKENYPDGAFLITGHSKFGPGEGVEIDASWITCNNLNCSIDRDAFVRLRYYEHKYDIGVMCKLGNVKHDTKGEQSVIGI